MSQDVCIFPIPGTAVLPFQTIQLHIFEPRYRSMVKYCVENDVLMAVSLAVRSIGAVEDRRLSREEALKSNQASYEPSPVFSAGKIKVLEEFDDGRFLIESTAQGRFRMGSLKQQVPFLIATCEKYSPGQIDPTLWMRVQLAMKTLLGHHFTSLDRDLLSKSEPDDIKFFHLLSRFQWPATEVQRLLEVETSDMMAESLLKSLEGVELVDEGDNRGEPDDPPPNLH